MSDVQRKNLRLTRIANLIVGAGMVSLIVLGFLGAYALASWIF